MRKEIKLTQDEKKLFAIIKESANDEHGYSEASNGDLGNDLNIPKSKISKMLTNLNYLGLIVITYGISKRSKRSIFDYPSINRNLYINDENIHDKLDVIDHAEEMTLFQYLDNITTYNKLSLKAKGLYTLILLNQHIFVDVKSDKMSFLKEHCKEGPDAIASGLKELVETQLIEKKIHRNIDGGRKYIIGSTWHIKDME